MLAIVDCPRDSSGRGHDFGIVSDLAELLGSAAAATLLVGVGGLRLLDYLDVADGEDGVVQSRCGGCDRRWWRGSDGGGW